MPKTTQEQIESRSIFIISFIFLFRYVTDRDLRLLGKYINVPFIRSTVLILLKKDLIASFDIQEPFKSNGYFLTVNGLFKVPKVLLQYEYFFSPIRYNSNMALHSEGVIEVCLLLKRQGPKTAVWLTEWMVRQDKIRVVAGPVKNGQAWKKLIGRSPDGLFSLNKLSRVAIEYEKNSKSPQNWIEMIKYIERSFRIEKKVDLATLDLDKKRAFESVLFVFNKKEVFTSYLERFNKYIVSKKEDLIVSHKRYFLTTLEDLRNGYVFRLLDGGGYVSRFNELGQAGESIFAELVINGVLQTVAVDKARLSVRLDDKKQLIRKVAKGNFEKVWVILQEFYGEKMAISEMFAYIDSSTING